MVGAESPATKGASKISKKKRDNTPLTNLSDVTEELKEESETGICRSTRTKAPIPPPTRNEGRKSPAENTEKRKVRKGRRKSYEVDDYYEFDKSTGADNTGATLDVSRSSLKRNSISSDTTTKARNKSPQTENRRRSQSPKTKNRRRSQSPKTKNRRRAQPVSDSPKKATKPKKRRSTSLEAVPRKAKKGSGLSKSLRETLAFESRKAWSSPKPKSSGSKHRRTSSLERLKAPFKFGRSASVPVFDESPKEKVKKRSQSQRKFHKDDLVRSENNEEQERSDRRERLRMKKESSLRKLNRKLDQTIGIQSSSSESPGALRKKKKALDLLSKTKEVEGLREKFRVSFTKVVSSRSSRTSIGKD